MECCLRPWHELYCSSHTRSGGGFPSGHMAETTYIAALFGMRYGAKYAIPLSLYAAWLGIVFVNCNRHYASQIIAGAGLGLLYACAAQRLIDYNLSEKLSLDVKILPCGGPSFGVTYRF
jgi:membrane-associated phospholipid phosphatase